jgi:hypothetical protein
MRTGRNRAEIIHNPAGARYVEFHATGLTVQRQHAIQIKEQTTTQDGTHLTMIIGIDQTFFASHVDFGRNQSSADRLGWEMGFEPTTFGATVRRSTS